MPLKSTLTEGSLGINKIQKVFNERQRYVISNLLSKVICCPYPDT